MIHFSSHANSKVMSLLNLGCLPIVSQSINMELHVAENLYTR